MSVLAEIGTAILLAQQFESLFKFITTFVIQEGEYMDLEKIQRLEKKERKKTLGYFNSKLKKRADLMPEFEGWLDQFIEDRNMIVHGFNNIAGFHKTEEEIHGARVFLDNFIKRSQQLTLIFVGFIRAWQKEHGRISQIPDGSEEIFEMIDRDYAPLIEVLLVEKK